MSVAIICIDKPNSLDLRLSIRPKHLEWLKLNLPEGTFVGPLLDDDGEKFKGSLYILNFSLSLFVIYLRYYFYELTF